jgi:putative nucleotidyltransferase with HDIG domain
MLPREGKETPPAAGSSRRKSQRTMRTDTTFFPAAGRRDDLATHSRSTAHYAVILARALGIGQERRLLDIERGALLHDVGKAAVPEHILCKRGPLTESEREIVREHPVVGFRMIEDLGFLKGASEIVLCHHEQWDGRGYPLGLARDRIPLGARIFALADTLDAMTADRPYQSGRPVEDALREIEKCGGHQFDPAVTKVFLSIPLSAWERPGLEAVERFRTPLAH